MLKIAANILSFYEQHQFDCNYCRLVAFHITFWHKTILLMGLLQYFVNPWEKSMSGVFQLEPHLIVVLQQESKAVLVLSTLLHNMWIVICGLWSATAVYIRIWIYYSFQGWYQKYYRLNSIMTPKTKAAWIF